jgi:vacuolar-type H+-ATPase subunit I/STV1
MSYNTKPDAEEYTVVGCSNCRTVYIVQGAPETSSCRRCQKRRQFKQLRQFYRTHDKDEAARARAFVLAKRDDDTDVEALRDQLDAHLVEQQEREEQKRTQSPRKALENALRTLEAPTEERLFETLCEDGDYDRDRIESLIERFRDEGYAIELSDGTLRLV